MLATNPTMTTTFRYGCVFYWPNGYDGEHLPGQASLKPVDCHVSSLERYILSSITPHPLNENSRFLHQLVEYCKSKLPQCMQRHLPETRAPSIKQSQHNKKVKNFVFLRRCRNFGLHFPIPQKYSTAGLSSFSLLSSFTENCATASSSADWIGSSIFDGCSRFSEL